MTDGEAGDASAAFDVQPNVGNHFAWLRTLMALERTQLASVRTSVSLIGFGFTVAQFFQKLRGSLPGETSLLGPEAPRDVGLILIAAGVVSLAMFTWEYHIAVSYLKSDLFAPIIAQTKKHLHRPTYLVSYVVITIGIAAFASIFLHF